MSDFSQVIYTESELPYLIYDHQWNNTGESPLQTLSYHMITLALNQPDAVSSASPMLAKKGLTSRIYCLIY